MCGGHPQICHKDKTGFKKREFQFFRHCYVRRQTWNRMETWYVEIVKHDKNQDNDKIIWFIIQWSIKLHGQREFHGLDSTPFVETVEKKALENLKFCETGQLGRIIPWPKYACEVDCCIFWYPCFRWLRWWWFAPQWNIFFIRWPGLNRWGLSN